MPLLETIKGAFERLTGFRRPAKKIVPTLVRERKAQCFHFKDDGETPNNPKLPLVLYRGAVKLPGDYDPAAVFEDLFSANGWSESWRDGLYDFLHVHTATHEVLGIARGTASVEFGGAKGRILNLKAGDVAILPAGTGHRRIKESADLLVVGAYPVTGKYDEPKPQETDAVKARRAIAKTRLPRKDPVYGTAADALASLWRAVPRKRR